MTFVESVKTCFKKYCTFKGRASRSEFWWFYLFETLVTLILNCIPQINFLSLLILLPGLAVTARRLHDRNRSGWWQIAPICLIVGACILGTLSANEENADTVVCLVGVFSALVFIAFLVYLALPSLPEKGDQQSQYINQEQAICPSCGKVCMSEDKFCAHCGAIVQKK